MPKAANIGWGSRYNQKLHAASGDFFFSLIPSYNCENLKKPNIYPIDYLFHPIIKSTLQPQSFWTMIYYFFKLTDFWFLFGTGTWHKKMEIDSKKILCLMFLRIFRMLSGVRLTSTLWRSKEEYEQSFPPPPRDRKAKSMAWITGNMVWYSVLRFVSKATCSNLGIGARPSRVLWGALLANPWCFWNKIRRQEHTTVMSKTLVPRMTTRISGARWTPRMIGSYNRCSISTALSMPSPELHTGLYEILTCNIHGQCRKDWLEVIAIYLVSDKLCDRNAIFERLSDASAHQATPQHNTFGRSSAS